MTDTTQTSDRIQVDDLDTFVRCLVDWHSNQVKTLEHFLNIPPGTEMEVDNDVKLVLRDHVLDGYRAGIQLALVKLGKLPF